MQNVRSHSATALAIVALVLAGTIVYQFQTTESQRRSCKEFYRGIEQNVLAASNHVAEVEIALLARIQADNSTIATLNSTKPPGYQSVIDTLSSDISTDKSAVRTLSDALGVDNGYHPPPPNPCG
jgi:hypothetical protein